VIALNEVIGCPQVILTHISHQFDVWMMDNPLPEGLKRGMTGWCWCWISFSAPRLARVRATSATRL
jgi:hypothetical protein